MVYWAIKMQKILAMIIITLTLLFTIHAVYWRITQPLAFVCDFDKEPTGQTYIAKEIGTIFEPKLDAPSCEDGTYMENLPYIGWLYKYSTPIGSIFLILTAIIIVKNWGEFRDRISTMEKD